MAWWNDLARTARAVWLLAEDLKRYQDELKEVRQELQRLSTVVYRLAAHVEAEEKHRGTVQENLILKVQAELRATEQRIERKLLSPPNDTTTPLE